MITSLSFIVHLHFWRTKTNVTVSFVTEVVMNHHSYLVLVVERVTLPQLSLSLSMCEAIAIKIIWYMTEIYDHPPSRPKHTRTEPRTHAHLDFLFVIPPFPKRNRSPCYRPMCHKLCFLYWAMSSVFVTNIDFISNSQKLLTHSMHLTNNFMALLHLLYPVTVINTSVTSPTSTALIHNF